MENFIYSIPTKIYFGKGEEAKTGQLIKDYHPKLVLIHYGSNRIKENSLLGKVETQLKEEGIAYIELGGVVANPDITLVREGIKLGIEKGVDFVLAIGGGSVLDSAKAIANGIANPKDDVWDYFNGKKQPQATLHKAAILTIAAAGSEMSQSCVISNNETQEKRGFNHAFNRFDFAIENPELTYSVGAYQTACGAVDIAMHSIERYFSPGEHNEVTDEIALAIIRTAFTSSKACIDHPDDYQMRANMMWASSLTHNDLTGMGKKVMMVVHQLGHEVSGMYPSVAHGAGLAALWCSWARYVYKSNIKRWSKYANDIWCTSDVEEAINAQEEYYRSIKMPTSLRELGVKESDLETLSLRASKNKTRVLPGDKPLAYEDMLAIYKMAY
ncbi:MAG: iron-containing alcohol dehydrogenase [Bacilli bacterium]|nr:iron-containing alcohol dehydrogenase [Bacilli bacterium]